MDKNNTNTKETTAKVELVLKGEDAEKFLAYKERQHLLNNAQTSYKLMMEALSAEVVNG